MAQHHSYKQSGLNVRVSQHDLEKLKNDIALNVAASYMQVLFNAELIANAERQIEATTLQRERTKQMVDAGSFARGALLDVESQLANEELQLVNAQNQYDISLLTLAQLIDLETTDGFSIVVPELAIPEFEILAANAGAIYNSAVTRMPEILAVDTRLESSERGFSIARAARYPRLTLSGSLSTNYSSAFKRFVNLQLEDVPFQDQLDQNFSKSVSLNLSIPIFNNYQTRTSVSRARIGLETARYNAENSRLQLRKTIQQSYADAVAALKRYNASQKSVAALRETLRYTEQRFNVGLAISLDYTNAKNNLNKAESELLQSKFDFIYRVKVLDFYQGKPLSF
jgi:outer membrane protein